MLKPQIADQRLHPNVIRFARKLRTNQTDAERRLWSRLRCRRPAGPELRRQHPFGNHVRGLIGLDKSMDGHLD